MNAKPKRGRPQGSLSFTTLTLAELNSRFKPEDVIPVGRIFLEKGQVTQKSTPQSKDYIVGVDPVANTSSGYEVEMTLQP